MKWYVIRVLSGKEKKMKDLIERELKKNGVENIISTLLIPIQKNVQIRKGKKVSVDKNLFPGYILVECESISEVETNIKHINGISSILKQPLSSSEIDRILGKEENKQDDEILNLNQKVRILGGPFNSLIGTIKGLDINKQKAKVSIEIFGRESILDLTFSQIVKE